MSDFDEWLKSENEKEKKLECLSRHYECDGCFYEEDCRHAELLNSIEEW